MPDPVLEIQIGCDGIRRVRVLGDNWSDCETGNSLLARIKPLLDMIHRQLTGEAIDRLQ